MSRQRCSRDAKIVLGLRISLARVGSARVRFFQFGDTLARLKKKYAAACIHAHMQERLVREHGEDRPLTQVYFERCRASKLCAEIMADWFGSGLLLQLSRESDLPVILRPGWFADVSPKALELAIEHGHWVMLETLMCHGMWHFSGFREPFLFAQKHTDHAWFLFFLHGFQTALKQEWRGGAQLFAALAEQVTVEFPAATKPHVASRCFWAAAYTGASLSVVWMEYFAQRCVCPSDLHPPLGDLGTCSLEAVKWLHAHGGAELSTAINPTFALACDNHEVLRYLESTWQVRFPPHALYPPEVFRQAFIHGNAGFLRDYLLSDNPHMTAEIAGTLAMAASFWTASTVVRHQQHGLAVVEVFAAAAAANQRRWTELSVAARAAGIFGRMGIAEHLHFKHSAVLDKELFIGAWCAGRVEVLQLLCRATHTSGVECSVQGIVAEALQRRQMPTAQTVEWVRAHDAAALPDDVATSQLLDIAMQSAAHPQRMDRETLPLLEWLHTQFPEQVTESCGGPLMSAAEGRGDMAMMRWLHSVAGLIPGTSCTAAGHALIAAAACAGDLSSVEWLYSTMGGVYDVAPGTAEEVAMTGHLPVLEFLAQRTGATCSARVGMQHALSYGRLDIAEYLARHQGLEPEEDCFGQVCCSGSMAAVEFMERRFPHRVQHSAELVQTLAQRGSLPMLEHVLAHSGPDGWTEHALVSAAQAQCTHAVSFLLRQRTDAQLSELSQAAARTVFHTACRHGDVEICERLHSVCGVAVAAEDMRVALNELRLPVVRYLHEECGLKFTGDLDRLVSERSSVEIRSYVQQRVGIGAALRGILLSLVGSAK